MSRKIKVVILSVLLLFGCAGRGPLPGTEDLDEPVAILPVIPGKIELNYSKRKKDRVNMAERINENMNLKASGKKSKLKGPKKVDNLLNSNDLEYLNSVLDQAQTDAGSWESKRLRNMGEKLGVAKIIRLELEIHQYSTLTGTTDTLAEGKKGDIYVTGHLFELSPPRLVTTYTSWAGYWREYQGFCLGGGGYGGCCILPVGTLSYKNKARAIDEAIEKSLLELLFTSAQEPTFQ